MDVTKLAHDIEAEKAVIGSCIVLGVFAKVVTIISNAEVFYDGELKLIYTVMKELWQSGKPTDLPSVLQNLTSKHPNPDRNYAYELMELADKSTCEVEYHAKRLVRLYQRRQSALSLYSFLVESQNEDIPLEETISTACGALHDVLTDSSCDDIISIRDVLKDIYDTVGANQNRSLREQPILNVMNHIRLYASRLVVLAADTSQGKTALSLWFTYLAAKNGTSCGFVSLEMPGISLGSRLLGMEVRVKPHDILHSVLSSETIGVVDKGIGTMANLPIYLCDRAKHSLDSIIATIRKMVWSKGVKMVVVDYVQILNVDTQKKGRTDEMVLAEIARNLQELAVELDICILLLSQFNRDSTATGIPNINRLRGSAQIAEASDITLILYRPEALNNGKVNSYPEPFAAVDTHGTAMLSIVKDRHGDTDRKPFILGFDGTNMRFFDPGQNIPTLKVQKITNSSRPF